MAKLSLKLDTPGIAAQFQGLAPPPRRLWPTLPRTLLLCALFSAILTAGWALYWRGLFEELDAGRQQEEAAQGAVHRQAQAGG